MEFIKATIQVGDTDYLKHLQKSNRVDLNKAFDEEWTSICKNGHVQMAQYLPNFKIEDKLTDDNQSCLHLAVSRNKLSMAEYLLNKKPELINLQSKRFKESPIFFALNNKLHKDVAHADKIQMVKLLLGQKSIDLGLKNSLGNTCYEAYADSFGYDEGANLAEQAHLQKLELKKEKESKLFLSKNIQTSDEIFSHVELNKRVEVQNILKQSEMIQEKLRSMQNETLDFEKVYDYVNKEKLEETFKKNMMTFVGA